MTFKPGHSGNPSGRPPGIVDKRTRFHGLFEQHAESIIGKLIEQATAGDTTALRLCIERIVPRVKPSSRVSFDLPEGKIIDTYDNRLQMIDTILKAAASGQITIEEAKGLAEILKNQCGSVHLP